MSEEPEVRDEEEDTEAHGHLKPQPMHVEGDEGDDDDVEAHGHLKPQP